MSQEKWQKLNPVNSDKFIVRKMTSNDKYKEKKRKFSKYKKL